MINWGDFENFFSTGIQPILLYPSLLISGFLIVTALFSNRNKGKIIFVLYILLIEYLFVVICSTIICRPIIISGFEKIQLSLFWTYRAIFAHTPGVSVWDIVLNVVLFLPFGFIVKLLFPSLSLGKMLLIAVSFSLCIETNQYVFEKGIAQIDDVMHNAIGAMIGWWLARIIVLIIERVGTRTALHKKSIIDKGTDFPSC